MLAYRGLSKAATLIRAMLLPATLALSASLAQAEIDGHGPDAWRVTGVSKGDVLNARMGPGTNYRTIESFAHDERNLQQVTCVPFHSAAHFMALSEAEIAALPPRWCLMRSGDLHKSGWVAQRFITPDEAELTSETSMEPSPQKASKAQAGSGDAMIEAAQSLVRDLYAAQQSAEQGKGSDPLRGAGAGRFFTADIVAYLNSNEVQAHPLYGAQDFDGKVTKIAPDSDNPMLRGMVTINVDFTNFGEKQRAIYSLRADTDLNNAPLRIFMVEHEGWAYP